MFLYHGLLQNFDILQSVKRQIASSGSGMSFCLNLTKSSILVSRPQSDRTMEGEVDI